ncbi:phage portal protein [Pararhizobium haloflavum]|uniref:phage portal protein n=1 Tax=Pararhizobium haloflavum TaxID=2037914 RepID=UPI000C1A1D3B|nr:phage portal protein [Pararhizobium haloflavum]
MKLMDRLLGREATQTPAARSSRPEARYLRDTRSGIISTRMAPLNESRDEISRAWRRSAGIALDLIQNSGRLRGAVDQVLADTVGIELVLNPQPDLAGLGYSREETTALTRLIKARWQRYAWNPAECDMRGKFTLPQLVDIGLRWHIAYGEVTGMLDYMGLATRQRYGIASGTKLCLIPPHRLVQDTNEIEGLFQGVYHDENGRPVGYLFEERDTGFTRKVSHPARDGEGRPVVFHVFDPSDATDVRGISVMAAAFRKHIQHEQLDDATLQTAILQTIFAAVLTSDKPSVDAFEALEVLKENKAAGIEDYVSEFVSYLQGNLEKAAESSITISGDPQISHLAPGEDLDIKSAGTPGAQYLPFSAALSRDMARAIGITFGGLTMNHENATYSSVRMETSSIWPVVLRRRERIAAPICQAVYESWLDEEIGEGRIPFKGGYRAFRANRDRVCWAQWQGPAKPTADDLKSAKATSERLDNGTSSIAVECGDLGIDPDELFEQRQREHQRYVDAGMRSPYERAARGDGGNEIEDEPRRQRESAA